MDIPLGTAEIDIGESVVAGSYQTVRYAFTAGHCIDDTGCIKIVFRYAGDFGTPQFDAPAEPNYCTVSTTGYCRIDVRWDPKGHTRPWGKALYLKVMAGFLDKGDSVTVVFGDRSQGSPGWQMQTFCEGTFEFKTLVDPLATYRFKELERSPVVRIVPGEPVKAVCIVPSRVRRGEDFDACLRLEDRWGNAMGKARKLKQPGFDDCGVRTIEVADEATGLSGASNPIEVVDEAAAEARWWADFHGQSEETIGSNSIDEYFRYARDRARVDIVAHQGNDFQITDAFWKTVNHTTEKYNAPGEFVTFPGYEWSGNTPLGGDRNVYHRTEGGPIHHSSHDLLPGERSVYTPAPTADELFGRLDASESFVFAHVGGRYADLAMHKEGVEVGVEVHSAWGTFEWLVDEALERGYRVGICANSDGHKGRPGASYPGASRFGSYGGLTCILAEALDRDAVFDALHRRRFYATTGHRALLDVRMEVGVQSAGMGDVIAAGTSDPVLHVKATGTAPIDYVEVRNGERVLETVRPYSADEAGRRIKVIWSGAQVKGRARKVAWDGRIAIKGNSLRSITPINFWNPDRQPRQSGPSAVQWQSITTGGLAGLILELDEPAAGRIEIETLPKRFGREIADIGPEPKVYEAGGLRKQIELYRLPRPASEQRSVGFSLPLTDLKFGDNPIYVKVVQQGGHLSWSSPIYVVQTPVENCVGWRGG